MTIINPHHSSPSAFRCFLTFSLLLFFTINHISAQSPGELDSSFDTGSRFADNISAARAFVIAPTNDNQLYIGGNFTSVIGELRNRIARLNADGKADIGFNPGIGANDIVHTIAVQTDGKTIIGGRFTSYNGVARNRIARINADGSLDTTFNPGTGADNWVYSTVIQSDGKIVIGGIFTNFNGTTRNRITRLNADGSTDTSFNPGSGAGDAIRSVVVQPDGKLIIGGNFGGYNGNNRSRIARLNQDGSLDTTFGLSSNLVNLEVRSAALQEDGKVIIAGMFSTVHGAARRGIARLNANGTLDTSFNPGTGATFTGSTPRVESVALQADGKILIGGVFESYNDTLSRFLARINPDGSIDTSFDIGAGLGASLDFVAVQADGKVLIGGPFSSFKGTSRFGIARLNIDGNLDPTFNSHSGAAGSVRVMGSQPNGKLLVGGFFNNYAGTERNGTARLNLDGSIDASFSPDTGSNNVAPIASLAMLRDGKFFLGGTEQGLAARSRIALIGIDGSIDTSFNPGTGANNEVGALAVQLDGKVLIGGKFTSYNGETRNGITRLNEDGSLDISFITGSGVTFSSGSPGTVFSVALQPDNKVIIGGSFTSYNGTVRNRIARLNSDGSLDSSFDPGVGPNGTVQAIALQVDGKVLIGGWFTSYNGTVRNRLARLNTDGSLDASFNPGNGTDSQINSIALQADGKVLIVGNFTSFNGIARNRITRLNSDGSLDSSFDPGAGANGQVHNVILEADGKVVIGGDFLGYDGKARSFLARVLNDPASESLSVVSTSRIEWLRGGSAPEVGQVTFEYSPDGMVWTPLGSGYRISGGWELTGLNLLTSGQIRARGRTDNNRSSFIIEQLINYSFASVPSVMAAAISEITSSSASGGGEVTSDGGDTVTERGLVYATTNDPTLVTGTKVIAGSGTGSFTANLASLSAGTTYYVRAYATNSAGTGYSSNVSFTTALASSNAKLSSLDWPRLSPAFDSDTLFYESFILIGHDETTLWQITPVAEDPNATITINGQPASESFLLSNPSNTLYIVVTAQDGSTTRTYTLVLRRPITYLVPGTNISLSYTVNGSTASIVGCNFEAAGALVIPSQLGGYNVTSIHPQAFQNITGLTSVTIPEGVVLIGDSAFYGAAGLTSITFPDSVVSIGSSAFFGCVGLSSIHIGSGLATIGEFAFDACENLTSFTVDAANLNYASSGGALFTKDMITLLQFPRGFSGAYVVPPGVSIIDDHAFEFCDGLTSVSFPSSLTTIGPSAFRDCDGLTSVTIPSSVITIGPAAFFTCRGLTHVTIGMGVTSIGNVAFHSCSSLTSATFLGNAPTSMGSSVFGASAPGFTIYYQEGAAGFTTPTWNGYSAFPISTSPPVTIVDANLEAAIRTALTKPTGAITEADMLTLTNLNLSGLGLTNISGLEKATNLRILDLRRNSFANAAALWAVLDQITPMYCLYIDVRRPGGDPVGLITQTVTDTSGGIFYITVDAPNLPTLDISGLGIDTSNQANLAALQVFSAAGVAVETGGTNLPPVANATASILNAVTRSVSLNGSASSDIDGTIASWAWAWSGGSATGANPTVTLPVGETTVTLTVTDNDGATSSIMVTVSFVPSLATASASEISGSTATLNGNVLFDGGAAITGRGFVYAPTSVNTDPVLGGAGVINVTSPGTTGAFSLALSDLPSGTDYTFKAYATNSTGTAYSTVATFTTLALPNPNLEDLILSEGALSPSFANEILSYESVAASSSTSILVTPVTADASATVTVNGQAASTPVSLASGPNTITILVTDQYGITTKTYTLVVIRQTTFADWAASRDVSDALGDPDQDGISNLLEYAFGLNPQISSSSDNLPQAETRDIDGDTYLTLSYTRPKSAGGLGYIVEFSNDPAMTAASTAGEYDTRDNGDGTETITVRDFVSGNHANPARFGRVRVVTQD